MILLRQDAGATLAALPISYDNHGGKILAIMGFFTSLACLVAVARLYVRAVILKTLGIDDYVMMLAVGCSIAVFVCFIEEVRLGVGDHISNPALLVNFQSILHWSYFHSWILVIGISSVKISVGCFLLRLVQGKWYKRFKRFILCWILFLIIFTLACVGTLVFQCLPVHAAWNYEAKPTAKCYSIKTFRSIGLFNGAINIFTDFIFATLPIPIILPLQINKRTKVSLIAILSLGYFACGASIVKEVLLVNFFNNPDGLFDDSYQIWNNIEFNSGILAACFPALRPLFAFLLETASFHLQSSQRRNSVISNPRHHYYIQDDDIKLNSLPSRSTMMGSPGYGVTVSGGKEGDTLYSSPSLTSTGPTSKLEQNIEENDSGSDENIWPAPLHQVYVPGRDPRRGIMRTTEVMITR